MNPRDYDPDFSYTVRQRRHAARMQLLGYAFLFLLFAALVAAIIAGMNHFLRFL
jgi:hypothetical protein